MDQNRMTENCKPTEEEDEDYPMDCCALNEMMPPERPRQPPKVRFVERTDSNGWGRKSTVKKYEAVLRHQNGKTEKLSCAEWVKLCCQETDEAIQMKIEITKTLKEVPFHAFVFETKGVSSKRAHLVPFEFVVIHDPSFLAMEEDWEAFGEYFLRADSQSIGTAFDSLKGDARLVVPLPFRKNLSGPSYVHLAAFLRQATEWQAFGIWKLVGHELLNQWEEIKYKPIWLSTSSQGVGWLHFRLDSTPRYYQYTPFKIPQHATSVTSSHSLPSLHSAGSARSLVLGTVPQEAKLTKNLSLKRSVPLAPDDQQKKTGKEKDPYHKAGNRITSKGLSKKSPPKDQMVAFQGIPRNDQVKLSPSRQPQIVPFSYEEIESGKAAVLRYIAKDGMGNPVTIHRWAALIAKESKQGHKARMVVNELVANCPFNAAFFETKGCNFRTAATEPMEIALVNAPSLYAVGRRGADEHTFAKHFHGDDRYGVAFQNLGGDARLIAPVPTSTKSGNMVGFPHLTVFSRTAPSKQISQVWRLVAQEFQQSLLMTKSIRGNNVWLSTSGLGVAWLHFRLDSSPKYYQYRPFASARSSQQEIRFRGDRDSGSDYGVSEVGTNYWFYP